MYIDTTSTFLLYSINTKEQNFCLDVSFEYFEYVFGKNIWLFD